MTDDSDIRVLRGERKVLYDLREDLDNFRYMFLRGDPADFECPEYVRGQQKAYDEIIQSIDDRIGKIDVHINEYEHRLDRMNRALKEGKENDDQ